VNLAREQTIRLCAFCFQSMSWLAALGDRIFQPLRGPSSAMSNNNSITVVIPCFNARRYIAATLDSVRAQAWPGLEVVVVDDGSSDGSADVVASDHPWVRLVRQANQGVAVARNTGIEHARGEWIAFVDADDIWLPGKLEAQWRLLQSVPDARMCYTAWEVWNSTEPRPSAALLAQLSAASGETARWSGASGWIYPELLLDSVVWTSTVLAQRSLFAEAGVFDPAMRIGEDWDLWLRCSRLTPILRVQQPLALYRLHPTSITKSVPETNYPNLLVTRAVERWGYAGPDGRAADPGAVRHALARSWCDMAGAHLQAGQGRQARLAAQAAVRLSPRQMAGWKLLARACAMQAGSRR
jgi:glycosyltransferase involved in cell wall biosynthesis